VNNCESCSPGSHFIRFPFGFFGIPRKQQGKVLDFVSRFRAHPDSPGINFKRSGCQGRKPEVGRIDDTYRGSCFTLLREICMSSLVDHHDDAIRGPGTGNAYASRDREPPGFRGSGNGSEADRAQKKFLSVQRHQGEILLRMAFPRR
jgi:hypothetical protein